jgi:hypothetical protein
MRRLLRLQSPEPALQDEFRRNPKRKNYFDGLRLGLSKIAKGSCSGIGRCAECGGEVKVLVSPRRNPHSSKLGRAVSMKDHDLCRRCWRRLIYQQRREGVVILPLAMFIGGRTLRPRLLMPKPVSLPREAS